MIRLTLGRGDLFLFVGIVIFNQAIVYFFGEYTFIEASQAFFYAVAGYAIGRTFAAAFGPERRIEKLRSERERLITKLEAELDAKMKECERLARTMLAGIRTLPADVDDDDSILEADLVSERERKEK